MVYSEVIKNDWRLLLPKKEKYTKNDVKVIIKKLLTSEKSARFIVLCTCIYHDTECSDFIYKYNSINNQVKRMF